MTERIERRWELPASVQDAWHAVTEPDWLTLWLADEVELELRPGGAARFRLGEAERTGWVEQAASSIAVSVSSTREAGSPSPLHQKASRPSGSSSAWGGEACSTQPVRSASPW